MDYAAVGMALRRLDRKLPDAPDLQRLAQLSRSKKTLLACRFS